jgi:hypothetical protein
MQSASFIGFIKTIIYILAVFSIVKFLAKLFFPILVKKVVKDATENFQKQQQYTQGNSWKKTPNNEEVIINATKAKKPRETKKIGDYVDYEEID